MNILVVEDNQKTREDTIKQLKQIDTLDNFFEASTGKEAIEIVQNHYIDVALIDYQLPDILGDEVLARLKEIQPSIHIAIATGTNSDKLVEKVCSKGAERLYIKPLPYNKIINYIFGIKKGLPNW